MISDDKAALTELLDQGQVWAEHMVQDSSPVFVHVLMAEYLLDSGWLAAHDAGVRSRAIGEVLDAIDANELNTDQAREGFGIGGDEQ